MTLRLDTPEAALAATPYLLTFTPTDSLVLLLLTEQRNLQVSLRVDLPAAGDPSWLLTVLHGVPDPVPDAVLLIAYADAFPAEHAQAVGEWVMHALSPIMDIVDLLVVADGGFRRVLGDPEGQARSMADVPQHPVVAECVAAGMTCAPNRDVLVAALAHVDDEVTDQVRRLLRQSVRGDYRRRRDELEESALTLLLTDTPLTAQDVVCVARACRDVHVRDPLLTLMLAECAEDRYGLGRVRTRLVYCLRHTPGRHAGSVAATLALVCWADGDGAAALVAVDRAMASDPANTLAPLVADALQNSLPPDTWATITGDIPLDVMRGRRRRSA
ncbi:MAG: DUF4192 domain-containing protein [Candidatus Nanopelagicales bacterium]